MLDWNGDALKARARRAALEAIAETIDASASQAAAEWPRDTGLSAESIEVLQPATSTFDGAEGAWGAAPLPPGEYSESSRERVLLVEFGFRGRAGLGLLRRTSDEQNRELGRRVGRRFRR